MHPHASAAVPGAPPLESWLLRLFASLAPGPIEHQWLASPTAVDVAPPGSSPDSLAAAIANLLAGGHLVAGCVDGLPTLQCAGPPTATAADDATCRAALRLLDAARPGDPADPRHWPCLRRLLPHLEHLLPRAEALGIAHPTGALLGALGTFWCEHGERGRGTALLQRALALDEAHFGADHPQVAATLVQLSIALDRPVSRRQSAELLTRALGLLLDHEHERPAELATALGCAAGLCRRQRTMARAEEVLAMALAIDERHFGAGHPRVARDLRLCASLWLELLRPDIAAGLLERARAIDAREDPQSPFLADDLRLLAATGITDAGELLAQAAAIDDRWYEPRSRASVGRRLALAEQAIRMSPARARSWLQELLPHAQALHPAHAELLAGALDQIEALISQGRGFDTEPLLQAFAAGMPAPHGDRLLQLAGTELRRTGRWHEWRRIQHDQEERQLLARATAGAADAAGHLAVFYKNKRPDYDAAERWYRRAIELAPSVMLHRFNLGLFLTRVRGRHDDAEPLLRAAVATGGDVIQRAALAFFLHHERGEVAAAAKIYEQLQVLGTREASVLGNAASLLLCRRDFAGALTLCERAHGAESESEISTRAPFLAAIASRLLDRDPAPWLARVRRLLDRAVDSSPWHPKALLALLPRWLPADEARFYELLQRHLFPCSGPAVAAAELEAFASWRAAR